MDYNFQISIRSLDLNLPIEKAKLSIKRNGKWILVGAEYNEGLYNVNTSESNLEMLFESNGYIAREVKLMVSNEKTFHLIRLLPDKSMGYLDRLEYFPGDRVTLRAHICKKSLLHLCRHGQKLETVLDLGYLNEKVQKPEDAEDLVFDGLSWEVSKQFELPKDILSGLYSLRILDKQTCEILHAIPLIINTPIYRRGIDSKILVMASNTTWQSYNIFGGRSRYRQNEGYKPKQFNKKSGIVRILARFSGIVLPTFLKRHILSLKMFREPNKKWKFLPLSIKRPLLHCNLDQDSPYESFSNHLAAGEWRLLAWMEREGIAYDYCSGNRLHFDSDLLSNYKAIVLSTHCEYWSKEMFDELTFHNKNKGLWIINASGNSIYREIEFFNDGSTRCKSLSFDTSYKDETELTGVRFDALDYGTAAPYKILDPNHWIFSTTNVKYGDKVGEKSLNMNTPRRSDKYDPGKIGHSDGLKGEGASGWECDKRPLKRKKEFKLLAKGLNKKGGAEMVIKEAEGTCGGIFSASSITFCGALLIDSVLSQTMKNLFLKAIQ